MPKLSGYQSGGGWNPVPQPGGGGPSAWGPMPQPQINNGPIGQPGGGSPWGAAPQPLMGQGGGGGGGGLMQMLGQIFGGGGGGGGQGGGSNFSLQSLLGLLNGPQGMTNYQQVFTGGGPSPLGGIDIPPAAMGDPFGGIRGEINPGDFHSSPFGIFSSGFGNTPGSGFGQGGVPTIDPTYWTNYPGVGNVPFAVPNTPGGWIPSPGEDLSHHTPPLSAV
jgi:hypothetical protein